MQTVNDLDLACINTIRTLSMDAVQAANSGHPGTPMALAPGVISGCWRKDNMRIDPMNAKEKPTISRCNKLHELPPVVTDWQQTASCPDWDYYDCGLCGNPLRTDSNGACPFDGKALPLREVPAEPIECN
jgi:hypothetical protein